MTRIILSLVTLTTISSAAGFDEEGSSKRNCEAAKKEALFLAKSTCLSLGAEDSHKEHFSKCRNKDGKHIVNVSYNCALPKDDDAEGYDPDYSESEDTSTTNL